MTVSLGVGQVVLVESVLRVTGVSPELGSWEVGGAACCGCFGDFCWFVRWGYDEPLWTGSKKPSFLSRHNTLYGARGWRAELELGTIQIPFSSYPR